MGWPVTGWPATLLKKRLWHRCFPVNSAKILRTSFSHNTSRRLLLDSPHQMTLRSHLKKSRISWNCPKVSKMCKKPEGLGVKHPFFFHFGPFFWVFRLFYNYRRTNSFFFFGLYTGLILELPLDRYAAKTISYLVKCYLR